MVQKHPPFWFWPIDRWKLFVTMLLALVLMLLVAYAVQPTAAATPVTINHPASSESLAPDELVELSGHSYPGLTIRLAECRTDAQGLADCEAGKVTILAETVADEIGDWQAVVPALQSGTHTLIAIGYDFANMPVVASDPLHLNVEAVPTPAPFTAPSFDAPESSDFSKQPIVLSGSAGPGNAVFIFDGESYLGTAMADEQGVWKFTAPKLAAGSHYLTARIMKPDGAELARSEPFIILVVPES